ncbi:MAG TPA: hypothetical protein VH186_37485 [Chloroflexia bacterium]|nr:hypothetical protein [Chloroflexia bacterium]
MTNNTGSSNGFRCTNPGLVRLEDVSSYASGDARPEFVAHLAECPHCRAEVQEFNALADRFDTLLNRKPVSYRQNCPDPQMLGDYAFNLLEGSARKVLKKHLDTCRYCQADYGLLLSELSEPAMPELRATVTGSEPSSEWLRRVFATLVPQRTQMALRGNSLAGGVSSLEFQAENISIVLMVQPARPKKNLLVIRGNVVSEELSLSETTGTEVRLMSNDETRATDTLDDTGSFTFENVLPEEDLKLEIQLSDRVILIENLLQPR